MVINIDYIVGPKTAPLSLPELSISRQIDYIDR